MFELNKEYSFGDYLQLIESKLPEINSGHKNLKIAYYLIKFDSIEGILDRLNKVYVVKNKLKYLTKIMYRGDVIEIQIPYRASFSENVIYSKYHLFFDKERRLLIFFFNEDTQTFSRTLEKVLSYTEGVHYLWVSPKSFNEIKDRILYEEPTSKITYFTAKRTSLEKHECPIRPEIKRAVRYSGIDGRESLSEMTYNYGVLPTTIEFYIPTIIEFRINNFGVFTLKSNRRGSMDYLFKIMDIVLEEILQLKSIVDRVNFNIKEFKTEARIVRIPEVVTGNIIFEKALTAKDAERIQESLKNEKIFELTDTTIEEGSLLFSSTVFDLTKNISFDINANEKNMTIIPEADAKFDSFLRFYQFIVENIDVNAKIEVQEYEGRRGS